MFVTRRLLQACRITLFSRDDCGLCTQAKGVLSDVWDKRPFQYTEVNLAKPEFKHWKNLYDFDIPVVSTLPFFCLTVSNGRGLTPVNRYILAKQTLPRKTSTSMERPSS